MFSWPVSSATHRGQLLLASKTDTSTPLLQRVSTTSGNWHLILSWSDVSLSVVLVTRRNCKGTLNYMNICSYSDLQFKKKTYLNSDFFNLLYYCRNYKLQLRANICIRQLQQHTIEKKRRGVKWIHASQVYSSIVRCPNRAIQIKCLITLLYKLKR
jgi:hypothetical protein